VVQAGKNLGLLHSCFNDTISIAIIMVSQTAVTKERIHPYHVAVAELQPHDMQN
jgi:hypothetical protein